MVTKTRVCFSITYRIFLNVKKCCLSIHTFAIKKYNEFKKGLKRRYLKASDPKLIPSIILDGFGYDLNAHDGRARSKFFYHYVLKILILPMFGTLVCINCWIWWGDESKSILIGNFYTIIGVPKVIMLPCGLICWWYPCMTRIMLYYLNRRINGHLLINHLMTPLKVVAGFPNKISEIRLNDKQIEKLTLSSRRVIFVTFVVMKIQVYGIIAFSILALNRLNIFQMWYFIFPGIYYTYQLTQYMKILTETTCATFLLVHITCKTAVMSLTGALDIPARNRVEFKLKVLKILTLITTVRKFNYILKYVQGFSISFSALILALLIYMLIEMDIPGYFIGPLALTSAQFAFLLSFNILSSAQVDSLLTTVTCQMRKEMSRINHLSHPTRFKYNCIINGSLCEKSFSCFDFIHVIDHEFYLKVCTCIMACS